MALHDQIVETTEVRKHNGQCAYGEWLDLSDEEVPEHVRQAVTDEVAEAICRDMRREPHAGNTDEAGRVVVGGRSRLLRRGIRTDPLAIMVSPGYGEVTEKGDTIVSVTLP